MSEETYYTALGVAETATTEEIKSAYRFLLKKIHPDTVSTLSEETRRGAEEATRYLNEVYSVLSEPGPRAEYDYQLAEQRRSRAGEHAALTQSRAMDSSSSQDVQSGGAKVSIERLRRRRRRRSRHRRHSSRRGPVKSLFRPVSATDWLVLFAYVILVVVLVAIAVVIISSVPGGPEDSSIRLVESGE